MTELQKAYLAGLFDGEGYFTIGKNGNGIRPLVGIDMTCERTIRMVHSLVGTGSVIKKSTNPLHKDQWKWRTSYNGARAFAAMIQPYLVTKKDGAEAIISHVRLKRGRSKAAPESI